MEIEIDDAVVVATNDTRNELCSMEICKVTEVHGRVKNPDENDLRWVVQKVDTTAYDAHRAQDEKAMETVMELEKRKTKRGMISELTSDLSEDEMTQLNTDLGILALPSRTLK